MQDIVWVLKQDSRGDGEIVAEDLEWPINNFNRELHIGSLPKESWDLQNDLLDEKSTFMHGYHLV
jgi:hypothetical protein